MRIARASVGLSLAALVGVACASAARPMAPTPVTAAAPPRATPPEVPAKGAAAWEAVQAAGARSLPALRACYARQLAIDPGVERHLALLLSVGRDGRVKRASFEGLFVHLPEGVFGPREPLLNLDVVSCLYRETQRWQLPATDVEGIVKVSGPPMFLVRFNILDEDPPLAPEVRAEMNRVVNASALDACFLAMKARVALVPTLRMSVHVVVSARRVREVAIDPPSDADAAFDACLLAKLRELDFSRSTAADFDFHYHFTFLTDD